MKTRRNIYLIIGVVLILLNLLVDIVNFNEDKSKDIPYSIGYFIGAHIFLLIGIILVRMAYKLHKKIINRYNELDNEIENIGKE
jgi:EamA domain-containing membrane protein RarD